LYFQSNSENCGDSILRTVVSTALVLRIDQQTDGTVVLRPLINPEGFERASRSG